MFTADIQVGEPIRSRAQLAPTEEGSMFTADIRVGEPNPYLRTAIFPNFCLRTVLPWALVNRAVNL